MIARMSIWNIFGSNNHNVSIVNTSGQNATLAISPIKWSKPQQNDKSGAANLAWRAKYTPLIGRGTEMAELKSWLNEKQTLSFKIIHADGGAGKTRLAAELAVAVHDKGWQAGMVSLIDFVAAQSMSWVGKNLLVIDYPEHAPSKLAEIIRLCVAAHGNADQKTRLRVLLLCRQAQAVEVTLRESGAEHYTTSALCLDTLNTEAQWALFCEVLKQGRVTASPNQKLFDVWRNQNSLHNQALFILALGLHLSHSDLHNKQANNNAPLWLGASALLNTLVQREYARWHKAELGASLPRDTIARIAAYATIMGGMPLNVIKPMLALSDSCIEVLRSLDLCHNADIGAMQPDLLAAQFLWVWQGQQIQYADTQSHDHLLQLIQPLKEVERVSLLNRWNMLGYDQSVRLGLNPKSSLETLLTEMSDKSSIFASYFFDALSTSTRWTGVAWLAVHLHTKQPKTDNLALEAQRLHNAAVDLSAIGERDAALVAAKRAVEIYERLVKTNAAAYEPDLAASLNNVASFYSDVGDRDAALVAAKRAVEIYERLVKTYSAAFKQNLEIAKRTLNRINNEN